MIILYALYDNFFLLAFGLALIIVFFIFLILSGKVNQAEKFKMSPEEEAEYQRKIAESERRGEEDAALIRDEDLDAAIAELQKLDDEKTNDYNKSADLANRKEAAYELMYTNAKLRTVIKRKMKLLKPDQKVSEDNKDD